MSTTEAVALVKAKSGKDITLAIVDDKTVSVGYDIKLNMPFVGVLSKTVVLNITVLKIDGDKLYLKYVADGAGIELVLKGMLAALPTFGNSNLIEVQGGNILILHLGEIEQIHRLFQQVQVSDISFKEDSVFVDFTANV